MMNTPPSPSFLIHSSLGYTRSYKLSSSLLLLLLRPPPCPSPAPYPASASPASFLSRQIAGIPFSWEETPGVPKTSFPTHDDCSFCCSSQKKTSTLTFMMRMKSRSPSRHRHISPLHEPPCLVRLQHSHAAPNPKPKQLPLYRRFRKHRSLTPLNDPFSMALQACATESYSFYPPPDTSIDSQMQQRNYKVLDARLTRRRSEETEQKQGQLQQVAGPESKRTTPWAIFTSCFGPNIAQTLEGLKSH